MFKNLLLIAFNYPQVLGKDGNARLDHSYVHEREEAGAGMHLFIYSALNCSFTGVLDFLDCSHGVP